MIINYLEIFRRDLFSNVPLEANYNFLEDIYETLTNEYGKL